MYSGTTHFPGMAVVATVLLLVLSGPGALAAQGADTVRSVRPGIEGILQLSTLGGETAFHIGAVAELRLERFSVGAQGMGLTSSVDIGPTTGPRSRLNMGYGGVLLGYTHNDWSGPLLKGTVLLGAGAAEHVDPFGNSVGKDVFAVIEPTAIVGLSVARFLKVSGAVGYRWVASVEDLGGPDASDLRSIVIRLSLRLSR